jgi:hypothetical protein
MTKNDFKKCIHGLIKDELFFTKKYQSKVFANVIDKDGDDAVTSIEISNKNFDNKFELFKSMIETKKDIQKFIRNLLNDDMDIISIIHTETIETDGKIVITKMCLDVVDGKFKQDEIIKYDISPSESFINEDGSITQTNPKLTIAID